MTLLQSNSCDSVDVLMWLFIENFFSDIFHLFFGLGQVRSESHEVLFLKKFLLFSNCKHHIHCSSSI
ncbi:unnamed protein product [Brugia timori]|uniref:Ovule protein n=1 Tax=Brugia timori TaxID=42155 RepID=A0A0R3Q4Z9_9BILA|nr:unnamed protein product [Brugia timori]